MNVVCLSLSGLFVLAALVVQAQGVEFHTENVKEVIANAPKEGKPVLIYFKAAGYDTCEKIDREVFADKRAGDCFNDKVVCCTVDVKADPSLTPFYEVRVVPTVVMLDDKGKMVYRMDGQVSPAYLVHLGNALTGRVPSLKMLYENLQRDKSNLETIRRLLLNALNFVGYLPVDSRTVWEKRLMKVYDNYRKVKSLDEMVNKEDYTLLTAYERPQKDSEAFDFIVKHYDRFKAVVDENGLISYLVNTNNGLIMNLARAGDDGYTKCLERINEDMAGVYKFLKGPGDPYRLMRLEARALYALYGKKDQNAYVSLENEYFTALGETLDANTLLRGIQELYVASKGKMTPEAAAICYAWVDVAEQAGVPANTRLQLTLVRADCCGSNGDKVKAKFFLNEAYLQAMQVGDQQMQQYVQKKIEGLER